MNGAVFRALKPGGAYVVVDSSAAPGSGLRDVQTLHRIDPEVVKAEVLAAGFRLAAESDFLRNPHDTRDWSASPGAAGEKRGTSDRFALRFVKP
jgi:predicted methyltransferase